MSGKKNTLNIQRLKYPISVLMWIHKAPCPRTCLKSNIFKVLINDSRARAYTDFRGVFFKCRGSHRKGMSPKPQKLTLIYWWDLKHEDLYRWQPAHWGVPWIQCNSQIRRVTQANWDAYSPSRNHNFQSKKALGTLFFILQLGAFGKYIWKIKNIWYTLVPY